ncbi:glycoside hydrolase superfamily [Microdochium trichocladiopsis]|uniref:chitinase n=1 Tax=Microdochium trichocladiopsis TaxID=1682393 RepID=A0A9P8XQE1_9PEZI|nr:glycoside hydrolase superfamily [Microdochium trichocladiopsis]KAH7010782.1 glycoside hydrolase superfamily [Microdochium trichocladiopsis]
MPGNQQFHQPRGYHKCSQVLLPPGMLDLSNKTGNSVYGMGPKYCGQDCTSQYGEKSEYSFYGTTALFCARKTVPNPQYAGSSSDKRTISYYEGWNYKRSYRNIEPEDIPLGWYTHINFTFALINPTTFRIAPMDDGTASHYKRVTDLKNSQPRLEAMNDPRPYRTTFSDLAKSTTAQDTFFESLLTFIINNSFDGEYPVAEDGGGIPEDFDNYVTFCRRLRERLNSSGHKFGISITLDSKVTSISPYAFAHTNITKIDMGLNLLWRNNMNPDHIVMGLGFYRRSFKIKDAGYISTGCPFESSTDGGLCTDTPGVLSAAEIHNIINNKGATVTFNPDNAETLKIKIDHTNERYLRGTIVWAINLNDSRLIEALGANIKRNKTQSVSFKTEWDMQSRNVQNLIGSV